MWWWEGRSLKKVSFLYDNGPVCKSTHNWYSRKINLELIPGSFLRRTYAWSCQCELPSWEAVVLTPSTPSWRLPLVECTCAKSLHLCPVLWDPMDCSLPGFCPWDSPGMNTGVGCHALLQGIFLTLESNPGLLHCRQILYHLSHQGSPQLSILPQRFSRY